MWKRLPAPRGASPTQPGEEKGSENPREDENAESEKTPRVNSEQQQQKKDESHNIRSAYRMQEPLMERVCQHFCKDLTKEGWSRVKSDTWDNPGIQPVHSRT